MCLIVFAWDAHKDYKLILAANRDEFYNRKSMKAAFWEDAPGVLAGRDLKAGGTWMGMHESGKIAAVTNYRDPSENKVHAPTRGVLPLNYLKGELGPLGYLKLLQREKGKRYNGFNLLTANQYGMFHYSNINNKINKIEKGIHGLSNATLDTPWPKVNNIKKKLAKEINDDFDEVSLLNLMFDIEKANDVDLPRTGVTLKWEKELSPIFIKTPEYGTCSTSVIMVGRDNRVIFSERIYSRTNGICKDQTLKFELKVPL
ncbi:MAG: NRDE family protein [Bacteroidota bacterium]